jgi:putative transcriptional regulator
MDIENIIAGEIINSKDFGSAIKKWREIFNVSQIELAKKLKVSPSMICDYESNRRRNPGVKTVKKIIDSLIEIDKERGGETIKKFNLQTTQDYFKIHDFSSMMTGNDFIKITGGEVLCGNVEKKVVHGFTLIDSLKVIVNFQYSDFQKLYGKTSERAFIFTKVTTGRSPMIAVKLAPIKPSIVCIHGLKKKDVDELAIKISEVENVPLVLITEDIDKVVEKLEKF